LHFDQQYPPFRHCAMVGEAAQDRQCSSNPHQVLHGLPRQRPLQAVCGMGCSDSDRLSMVPPVAIAANLKGGLF
jgi:hypothetical protein